MTPNNFRIKNGLTVSNGVTISAGNVVITSGQLVIGATAINATSMSDSASNAYSNAVTFAANASNANNGTLAFARLPSLFVGTTTIQSTSAAQAVSGITTLATGNTTITGFANVSTALQVGATSSYGEVVTTQFASVFGTAATTNPYSIMQVRSSDNTSGMGIQAYAGLYSKIYSSNGFVFTTGATLRDKDYATGGTDRVTLDSAGLTITGNLQISAINATSFGATLTSNTTTALLTIGNSSITTTMNSSTFSGTANNATNFGGSSLATVQGQITGNAATAYTNATIFAANASNANNGTLAFARLPSLFIGTTTIQSTSAAQAVSGITTLAAGNTTITGDITVSGNLTINGTTTNINSTNLVVEDKNIVLADVTTPTDVTADGGGITLKGATDKTLNWVDATDSWTSSEHLDIATGKTYRINGTTIANSTALGTGILASSLTSVGTLSSLTVGGISTFNGNVVLGSSGLSANGGFGTAAQVLHSNGTATYWAADDGITSLVAANGLNGGTITSTGTMSVLGGSTLAVNTTGVHVNSALSITSLTLAGAASGITTLAAGNTTITGFANVTTTLGVGATGTLGGTATNFVNNFIISTQVGNASLLRFYTYRHTTGADWTGTSSRIQQRIDVTEQALIEFNPTGYQYGVGVFNSAGKGLVVDTNGITNYSANVAIANNNIINPILTGYTEAETSNTAATGTFTMNCLASNFFDLTLTGNITISPSNVPPATRVWSGTIAAKQDATGGRTITWPTGIKWPGGSAPPATTTANAIDIWSLMTYDGGTTWVGSLSVKNVA